MKLLLTQCSEASILWIFKQIYLISCKEKLNSYSNMLYVEIDVLNFLSYKIIYKIGSLSKVGIKNMQVRKETQRFLTSKCQYISKN